MVVFLKFLNGLIHISGCNFGLNLLYIDSTNDPKCLGKEPWKFRGFEIKKKLRRKVENT